MERIYFLMSTLTKGIFIFKIPMAFFTERQFTWKHKRPKITKTIRRKKVKGIIISKLKVVLQAGHVMLMPIVPAYSGG
jgi:hypothetical protein